MKRRLYCEERTFTENFMKGPPNTNTKRRGVPIVEIIKAVSFYTKRICMYT